MELKEVLRFADEQVFAKTGKHLEDLQKAILTEALQGRKYAKVAQDRDRSEGYVRVAAAELWKILADALGEEEVSKVNVRSKLERAIFYNSSQTIGNENVTINNHLNTCSERARSPTETPAQATPPPLYIDLGDAPELFSFSDSPRGDSFASRTTELATLEKWIVNDKSNNSDIPIAPTRLSGILGISGIGKTALAIRLIDRIKTQFNYVIYRSLRFSPTLETTLTNLLQIFSASAESSPAVWGKQEKISEIFNYLRQYRCLIILDDVEGLFGRGQLAGQYKSGYEDYQQFFQQVAEVTHHSCFLLISSEQPRELAELEKSNYPVRSLVLGSLGIAAKDILTGHQLSDESSWETLINTYQGNPLWLNITATLIAELFGGSVADFWQYDMPMLDESLRWRLEQQFQRLTEPEIAVITQLAKETEPAALPELLNQVKLSSLELSPTDLINAVRSLVRRFLVETEERGKTTCFTLNSVVAQYVKTRQ